MTHYPPFCDGQMQTLFFFWWTHWRPCSEACPGVKMMTQQHIEVMFVSVTVFHVSCVIELPPTGYNAHQCQTFACSLTIRVARSYIYMYLC